MSPDRRLCPDRVRSAFELYRDQHVPPGDFVRACLENNLLEAFLAADDDNLEAMPHIVAWLYWEMPSNLWKSMANVRAHLSGGKEAKA